MKVIDTALSAARMVVRAARQSATAAALGTALALMLGLGGCAMSHGSGTDADGDGYDADIDCDDGDPSIYPGAPEPDYIDSCEEEPPVSIDLDCDGIAPPIATCNRFLDADLDGHPYGIDCDDDDPTIYPGAPEPEYIDSCEDPSLPVDMDCDGVPPPILTCNPIPDADGDGYLDFDDCDDTDPAVHPGAVEPPCPDGVDQNCDGVDGDPAALCELDEDHDGYPASLDCDDLDPLTYPGAPEGECADGVDQNCNGVDDGYICNGMADAAEDDVERA